MALQLKQFGQGEPLVFFHGWGFDSSIWFSLLPHLEAQYRVILVDLPGFGSTPFINWELFQEKLLAQLPQIFSVVGWSLGGLYATHLALNMPNRVKRLLNVASSPCFLRKPYWPGLSAKEFTLFNERLQSSPQKTAQEFIAFHTRGLLEYKQSLNFSYFGLMEGMRVLEQWDLREPLLSYPHQVGYLFGGCDALISTQTMHRMRKCYSHFDYFFLKRATHTPFLSHPILFIEALEDFMQ
ncbi:MAG: hypothetical protein BGO90_01805 [Legionella sp. 40-6]|nr:alpha/beta fold hydrolase [Legionella sp.]OJY34582.1 MAG: hypothetical protein BGO90_01805 [Legionella sp. 40-6]